MIAKLLRHYLQLANYSLNSLIDLPLTHHSPDEISN